MFSLVLFSFADKNLLFLFEKQWQRRRHFKKFNKNTNVWQEKGHVFNMFTSEDMENELSMFII